MEKDENACSCIRKRSFGEEKGNMCVCGGLSCFGGVKSDDDDEEFEGGEGEGELVRIDKGLSTLLIYRGIWRPHTVPKTAIT